jgi:phosphate transport system protein
MSNVINQMELDIEEECLHCLHCLACDQPVAQDLRFVVAVLKINTDLERIADLAANIAEKAALGAGEVQLDHIPFDMPAMAGKSRHMLNRSLDALVNIDVAEAKEVCRVDDAVDALHRQM